MNRHEDFRDDQQRIPPSAYTSERCFRLEIDQLFSRYWNFAGMVDDIPEPGDFQCLQAGRYPLVVLRDTENRVRAFHNICSHRGLSFLEGKGNSLRGLTCPYHRWFYKLDGRLKAVPNQARLFPDLDKSQLGLQPASVGIFRGMLFVHPDASPTEPFETFLDDLDSEIGPHHPDRMVEIERRRFEFGANWKIVVENYLDTYHLLHLHDKSVKMLDHSRFDWQPVGRHILIDEPIRPEYEEWFFDTYGISENDYVPGIDPGTYGGQFHMLFPNIGWTALPHLWNTFHAIPVAADRTIVETRARVMPSAVETLTSSEEFIGRFGVEPGKLIRLDDLDTHPLSSGNSVYEDMWVCRQMQKGVESPAYRIGAFAKKFETMLPFHQSNVLEFLTYPTDPFPSSPTI